MPGSERIEFAYERGMDFAQRKCARSLASAWLFILVSLLLSYLLRAEAGSIVWENQGLTNGAAYSSGSTASSGGATLTTSWTTVTDGGFFGHGGFADFVTYQAGTTGNHSGLLLMAIDNTLDDPDDQVLVEFSFDTAVTNLSFSLLDIDDDLILGLDDFVEVFYDNGDGNWINIATLTSFWTAGSRLSRDNETFGDGWESDSGFNVSDTSTAGNLNVAFGSTAVKRVKIRYSWGNDPLILPLSYSYVGISDLTYDDLKPLEVTTVSDTGSYGSLRFAMNYANANTADDDIVFNISGTGPFTLSLSSALPAITDTGVTIDGTSQTGTMCNDLSSSGNHTLMVEIAAASTSDDVLTINANNVSIAGLALTGGNRGIAVTSATTGLTLQCNHIGVGPDGVPDGNTAAGIAFSGGTSTSALVGGETAGNENLIAYNGGSGVELSASSHQVALLRNAIHTNTGLPIDLNADGVTANDSGDADTGPNDLLNRPQLDGLYADGTGTLTYYFALDAPENANGYRIELFRTPSAHSSGSGDLKEFVMAIETGAHAGGSVLYSASVAEAASLTNGDIMSATVTAKTGISSYSVTSEAAGNFVIQGPYDYTDIPLTGTSYGSARHAMNPYVYLGSAITGDITSFDAAAADGDDDDGVTLPSLTQNKTIELDFAVTGSGGYLSGWVDWNGDGDFDDTVDGISEVVASDITDGGAGDIDGVTDGQIALSLLVPTNATTSQTFSRFRWSTDASLSAIADAGDGEVEDYALLINGAAVITASMGIEVYDTGALGLHAVPGNDVLVSISATNIGSGPSDADSIVFFEEVDANLAYYYGATPEFSGDIVGWTEAGSGLTFSSATDVKFSNSATRPTGMGDCTYSPSAGYDGNVRFLCFNPKGAMLAGDPDPSFSVQYRARIQ